MLAAAKFRFAGTKRDNEFMLNSVDQARREKGFFTGSCRQKPNHLAIVTIGHDAIVEGDRGSIWASFFGQ